MARSPIPQLIEDFHQMTPEEQRCFLDLVDPQPEPQVEKATTKKKRTRGGAGGGNKSLRASNMAATLNKNLTAQRQADNAKCAHTSDGKICLGAEDDRIHDKSLGYLGHHEFVAPRWR